MCDAGVFRVVFCQRYGKKKKQVFVSFHRLTSPSLFIVRIRELLQVHVYGEKIVTWLCLAVPRLVQNTAARKTFHELSWTAKVIDLLGCMLYEGDLGNNKTKGDQLGDEYPKKALDRWLPLVL